MKRVYIFLISFFFWTVFGDEAKEKNEKRRSFFSSYDPPLLPEIVINRAKTKSNSGYSYPIPNPPISFDEPPIQDSGQYLPPLPTISAQDEFPPPSLSTYLPPPIYSPINVPDDTSPQFDPIDTPVIPSTPEQYLPPPPPSDTYGVPYSFSNQVQARVSNMSCLDISNRRFFRANLKTSRFLETPPVIDDSTSDCVSGNGNYFRFEAEGSRMAECGVRYCTTPGRNLCVQVRVPTVKGLKLPEDYLITMQCKPQDVVAERTKQIRLNPQLM